MNLRTAYLSQERQGYAWEALLSLGGIHGSDFTDSSQAHLNWHHSTRHILTLPPTHQGLILDCCPTLHATWPLHGGT